MALTPAAIAAFNNITDSQMTAMISEARIGASAIRRSIAKAVAGGSQAVAAEVDGCLTRFLRHAR